MTPVELPCRDCLRRSWLICALAGHLELLRHRRGALAELLALPDVDLLALGGEIARPKLRRGYEDFDARAATRACAQAGVRPVCRHDELYPANLKDLQSPPAVVYVAGRPERLAELLDAPVAAVVGTRQPTDYGVEMARSLGRGLAAAGVTVVSGLALGIDAAAQAAALSSPRPQTIGVLAGAAEIAYPARMRSVHEHMVREACVVSEAPPGTRARRWAFLARNRIIAALAALTVVVEGTERSGSLVTAELALGLGRRVGAVPGRVTSSRATAPNGLLAAGALVVRDAADVLDVLCGIDCPRAPQPALADLEPRLAALIEAVAAGADTLPELVAAGLDLQAAMMGLSELELMRRVRRTPDGRYTVIV